jgi:hypothetical protein
MRQVLLIAVLLLSPFYHRDPSMPLRVERFGGLDLTRHAHELSHVIPKDAGPVFVLGNALIVHLAGREILPRQATQWWVTFLAHDHPELARMGLWGPAEMRRWISQTRYVVIDQKAFGFYKSRPPYEMVLWEMRLLMWKHERVATVGPLVVYRRKG